MPCTLDTTVKGQTQWLEMVKYTSFNSFTSHSTILASTDKVRHRHDPPHPFTRALT